MVASDCSCSSGIDPALYFGKREDAKWTPAASARNRNCIYTKVAHGSSRMKMATSRYKSSLRSASQNGRTHFQGRHAQVRRRPGLRLTTARASASSGSYHGGKTRRRTARARGSIQTTLQARWNFHRACQVVWRGHWQNSYALKTRDTEAFTEGQTEGRVWQNSCVETFGQKPSKRPL